MGRGMGLHGLAITSNNPRNLFHGTKAWRSGCVMDIPMLQRQDMIKPEARSELM